MLVPMALLPAGPRMAGFTGKKKSTMALFVHACWVLSCGRRKHRTDSDDSVAAGATQFGLSQPDYAEVLRSFRIAWVESALLTRG